MCTLKELLLLLLFPSILAVKHPLVTLFKSKRWGTNPQSSFAKMYFSQW